MDWLSRLFERCAAGSICAAPMGRRWRIDQGPGAASEIPYHAILAGSTVLDDPSGGRPLRLKAGDILLLSENPRPVLHDGSGMPSLPAKDRTGFNFTISENAGTGKRLGAVARFRVMVVASYLKEANEFWLGLLQRGLNGCMICLLMTSNSGRIQPARFGYAYQYLTLD